MSRSIIRRRIALGATISAAAAVCSLPAVACGPFFPNQLLFDGGHAVAWAPVASFRVELDRLVPRASSWTSVVPEHGDVFGQTIAIDVAELARSLDEQHVPEPRRGQLLSAYERVRRALAAHGRAANERSERGEPPEPAAAAIRMPDGLGEEFALYLGGLLSYHRDQLDEARGAWQTLLDLPAAQRRHRSIWAAFMLGKSYLGHDPVRAAALFQQVRALAKDGMPDPLGLAASSLGWEARAELDQRHEVRAMSLYLDQVASGDPTAAESLAAVCARIFRRSDHAALRRLAADGGAAKVVTAYCLAQGGRFRERPDAEAVKAWLRAVEEAGNDRVVGADRLAWSAYQAGDMDAAERWSARAPAEAPIAMWVRAKLLLRAGKIDAAAQAMARAAHAFPTEDRWPEAPGTYASRDSSEEPFAPHERASAELGVLQLARGRYADALDQLLNAGWWLDAAYVAERVLTEDELIAYVDRSCPEGHHPELRHLLARRLTRAQRWDAARTYFPPKLRARLDAYVEDLRAGQDESRPRAERGASLWSAARIARYDGMALMGTELAPDDYADAGNYEGSGVAERRRASTDALLPPTPDELARSAASVPRPLRRWHYRYVALEQAWAAAQLMPNETDALATVLCEAGSWAKARDPKLADRFYKALVTRCATTALGRDALRIRWFPKIRTPELSK